MPTRPWPIATFAALILIAFLAPSVLAQEIKAQGTNAQDIKAQDIKPQNTRERWYILELAGSPAGHMSSITTTTGEGDARTITTDASLVLSIARAGAKINVTQESRFVETAAGKPISMRSRQVMGGEIIQEYVFKEDSVELTTRQPAGEPKVSTLKLPEGPWLPPAAAEAYARQRVAAGATELTVRTMDPTLGPTIITAERKIGAKTTIEIAGRAIAVTEHTVTMSNMPGMKTTEMVDEAGDMVLAVWSQFLRGGRIRRPRGPCLRLRPHRPTLGIYPRPSRQTHRSPSAFSAALRPQATPSSSCRPARPTAPAPSTPPPPPAASSARSTPLT